MHRSAAWRVYKWKPIWPHSVMTAVRRHNMETYSIDQTFNIDPPYGLGPIKIGATPDEVRAVFGSDLVWEDWMDGNMNNCLYYHGLVFHFDRCDSRAPLPSASLTAIEICRRDDCLFRDRRMTDWTVSAIREILTAEGIAFTSHLKHAIAVPQLKTEISFQPCGRCNHFWLDGERIEYPPQELTWWKKVRTLFN